MSRQLLRCVPRLGRALTTATASAKADTQVLKETESKTAKNPSPNHYSRVKAALDGESLSDTLNLVKAIRARELRALTENELHIRLFKTLADTTASTQKNLPVNLKTLFYSYLDARITIGWMCAVVIVGDIVARRPQEGLETWVRFLETLNDPSAAALPTNREAAWAALVAYICNCLDEGVAADSTIASKLVPIKQIPGNEVLTLQGINQLPAERQQKLLDELKKLRMAALDYNSAEFIQSLSHDQPKRLQDSYLECVELSRSSGVALSELTYSRFIACFAEAAMTTRAFEVWNDMQAARVVPSIMSWNSLLRAGSLMRNDNKEVFAQIWQNMVERANIKPDIESYCVMVDMLFRLGQVDEAFTMFKDISQGKVENVAVSLKLFSIAVNGLLKNKRIEEAEQLTTQFRESGYTASTVTYNSFLRTYIDEKMFDKALGVLDLMNQQDLKPNIVTYSNVIDATFKLARLNGVSPTDRVEALIREMGLKGIKTNAVAMTTIIDGLIKTDKDIDAARAMFDIMIKKRIQPNARTFTTLIDGEVSIGDMSRAMRYFDMMPRFNINKQTATYNLIIRAMGRKGDIKNAWALFGDLVKNPRTHPNKFTYDFLLRACDQTRNTVIAQQVLQAMADQLEGPVGLDLDDKLMALVDRLQKNSNVQVPPVIAAKMQ